ncbi:hypothetical protein NE848_07580 [Gramella jeungdoensis]|uniref:asparagine synthase (glutamine-hydrolyzing) n=1 Tax=Gramella jeungdoensis TaxID=708091 RepID=A0ABT0Z378_9FLAO|nr:hypothetical protein [Gramella jeungdoensis]MCM8569234.1 hypothetical protein [Gramella jeungdoensis]
MKFIFSNKKLDPELAKDFNNLHSLRQNSFDILINDKNTITETENEFSITNGYLKDFSLQIETEQKISAAQHVLKNWPVCDNITGSFSSIIFDKKNSEIVIATDPANIYPLYYLKEGEDFFISNSLILLGRYSNTEFDKAGIFQRAVGPSFMNIGSRTILKNCKSLLPGEWVRFDSKGKLLLKKFDNSLYQNIGSAELKENQIKTYWSHYKKEVELCTAGSKDVSIALSGGIDSRIALGAIPEGKRISAYTYGESSNYESKIAKKLAATRHASHSVFFDPGQYFPEKETLVTYTKDTESVKLNSWLEILKNVQPSSKHPILLGELCEGLPARNITKFNSTEFRKKNFIKYYIRKERIPLTPSNPSSFENWKKTKKDFILSWHVDFWFEKLDLIDQKKEIIRATLFNTEEIFDRIEEHNLPYTELYDELFSWYTFTRMELSRQVNICNEKFYAYSPGMSIQMLKRTSNIHPNLRLYYRFANKLLKETPELKKFKNIPTSQIPIIPQTWSNIFKIPVWGLRSKIDDWLIKRMMKSKDIQKRYRLFKSINWAKVYQQKDMLDNLKAYYEYNNLSKAYFETFFNLAKKRKTLKSWPFANMDIISGATLNTELGLIKKYKD